MDQNDKTWVLVLAAVIITLIALLVYRIGISGNVIPAETPIPTPTSEAVPEISLPPLSTITSTPSATTTPTTSSPTPVGNIIPAPITY